MTEPELTILMPCLNEEKSLAFCVREARKYLEESGVFGEILIVDNGSRDKSPQIARKLGVRVIPEPKKGYGSALRTGIREARGRYVVMGDCDGSYDFSRTGDFLEKLRQGCALVVGNRYKGGIEKKAMPFSHQYVGVPILSFLGRIRYQVDIGDFHCGMRGFDRKKALSLGLSCDGMEFATELIGRFAQAGEPVCEIPAKLRRDRRKAPSHLRALPDGLRHVRLILGGRQTRKRF